MVAFSYSSIHRCVWLDVACVFYSVEPLEEVLCLLPQWEKLNPALLLKPAHYCLDGGFRTAGVNFTRQCGVCRPWQLPTRSYSRWSHNDVWFWVSVSHRAALLALKPVRNIYLLCLVPAKHMQLHRAWFIIGDVIRQGAGNVFPNGRNICVGLHALV